MMILELHRQGLPHAHQSPRSIREQPVEAPQLVCKATRTIVLCDDLDPRIHPGHEVVPDTSVRICGSDLHAHHGLDSRRVPLLNSWPRGGRHR